MGLRGNPATQAELDAEATTRGTADTGLDGRVSSMESRRVQNLGVDLAQRTKLNVDGGARAIDNGSGADSIDVRVVNEVIWLPHVALDNGFGDLGEALGGSALTQPVRDTNTAILLAAIALVNTSDGTSKKTIRLPPRILPINPLRALIGEFTIEGPDSSNDGASLYVRGAMDTTKLGGDVAFDLRDGAKMRNLAVVNQSGSLWPTADLTAAAPEQYGTAFRLFHGGVENVSVSGFCYGIDARGDHVRIAEVDAPQCWAALYYGPNAGNAGDAMVDRLFAHFGGWCGIAVAPAYQISSVLHRQCHFVSTPFGIWKMAQSRRLANYTTGTVSFTNGGVNVVGSGTAWKANVKDGSQLKIGSTVYYVSQIIDDTHLTLVRAYTGATASGISYTLEDGATPTVNVMIASGFEDCSFEGVNCKIACEDGVGTMASSSFTNCGAGWWPTAYMTGAADAGCLDYHIKGMAAITDLEMDDESASSMLYGSGTPNVAAIQSNLMQDVTLGELALSIDQFRLAGKPYVRASSGSPVFANAVAKYLGSPILFGRARAQLNPFDALQDGGYGSASNSASFGQDVKPHSTAKADVIGASLGIGADVNDGIPYLESARRAFRVNVAPSCVASADAVSGAGTITTFFTSRLGASGASVTLQTVAGVSIGVGVLAANGTDITFAGGTLAALTKGTQLWAARTAGATLPINTLAKMRYGSAGSAATDVGQAIAAAGDWSDAPLIGSTSTQADTGRTAIIVPQKALLAKQGVGTVQVNDAAQTQRAILDLLSGASGLLTVSGADDAGGARTKVTFDLSTAAQAAIAAAQSGGALYGKGSDGAFDFDGVNAWASSIATFSGSTYTLKKPIFATTLVVRSGITLKANGFPVYATTSITVDAGGVIDDSAPAAVATAAGAVATAGLYGALAGAQGGTAAGTAGTSTGFGMGTSGAGGLGPSGAGGGVGNAINTTTHILRIASVVQSAIIGYGGVSRLVTGGPAGGSGGGDGTNRGGGSGGGGPVIALFAPTVTNNGTINAKGGNGGTPTAGNAGGGGGGSGGVIVVFSNTAWTAGTTSVVGGSGGGAVGTGAAGSAGSAGSVLNVV